MMAEQGRNMSLNQPVVDLHLLFVCCVKTVQFNKFVTCTQWDGNNQIQGMIFVLDFIRICLLVLQMEG